MTQSFKLPPQHRIDLEDVYRDYQDGLLSVKGAVFYAVAASRKFGHAVNLNVGEFLERTGIHKGSYARALAALINEGRLDFPPNALQTLRVPVLEGTDEPAYYSLTASRSQICDRTQQICDRRSQICDRTQQICDRRSQICDREVPQTPIEEEVQNPSISLSSLSLSLSSREREEDVVPAEYEEWLTKKASQLPTPPTLLEEWIEKNRNKKSNRKQFFKYREALKKASVPQPAPATIFEVQSEQQQRLETLQFWWDDGSQVRVRAAIDAHPEWQLRVGQFGPEIAEVEL